MSDPATPFDPAPLDAAQSVAADSLVVEPPPFVSPSPDLPAEEPASLADAEAAPTAATAKERHSNFREYAESLLVTILLALFGTTFVVQAFKIPSQSMEPTLLVGDHLLVNKFVFGGHGAWYERVLPYRTIHRGDIIVFKYPYEDHPDHPHYVKRVIGLPGERLRVVGRRVFINGKPIEEPYAVYDPAITFGDPFERGFPPTAREFTRGPAVREEWSRDILSHVEAGELLIPPGHYFVMGDNRDSSSDSRFWGFVPRNSIMGRPILIYWSVTATSDDYADRSFSGRLVGFADTLIHLPAKTRWSRMFLPVD